MLSRSVARRYAAALFDIAREKEKLGEIETELSNLVETIDANRDLKRVFYHRLIKEKDKKAIIKEVFSGRVSPILMNFINLLIDKRREVYLVSIKEQYIALANEARNILDADVTSAIELAPNDIKDLQGRLSQITGKNVRIRTSVDPKIIGGLVIKVGDRVIDGSILKRLQLLKANLTKAQLRLA